VGESEKKIKKDCLVFPAAAALSMTAGHCVGSLSVEESGSEKKQLEREGDRRKSRREKEMEK